MKSWNHLNAYSHLSYKRRKEKIERGIYERAIFSKKFKYEFDITIYDFVFIIYNPR